MIVLYAKKMGFCHGVRKAFNTVMELGKTESAKAGDIIVLGEIVHNSDVVSRVVSCGISNARSPSGITNKTVVLRTHGEERDRINELVESGNELIDCTCPIVKKVRMKALDLEKRHPAVVIVGKKNHPEIVGLVSWLTNPIVVLADEDFLELPDYPSIGVVGQTTLETDMYAHAIKLIEAKYGRWDPDNGTGAEWLRTICNHTILNQNASTEIAKEVDIMIVVGSPNSSNSRKLYEKCIATNPNTLFSERLDDLDISIFTSQMKVGITSGASTPDWVIEEIKRALVKI